MCSLTLNCQLIQDLELLGVITLINQRYKGASVIYPEN
jgi:hypothetical protein